MTTLRKRSHLAALEEKEERSKDIRTANRSKTNKLSRGINNTQFSSSSTKNEDEKTPKRYPSTSHHTSYSVSPCNDNELQQDIFWDPSSPTPARFGKGEKKHAVGRAVEISDIVNRIAPKDEKPASHEVPLLEMWIGDNAIPCTPGVLRARPKKHSFRASDVEDLMKLAKQFDRNMIQDAEQNHGRDLQNFLQDENEDQMESDMHEKVLPSFLGELTGTKKISPFNLKNAGIQEEMQIKNSSQKLVNQEAEADFIALFDGPTQLLSGRQSPNLSKSSLSSPKRNCMLGAETNEVTKKSTCKGGGNFKFNKPPGFGIKPNSYQNATDQCPTKHKTVSSSKPHLNGLEMASKVSSVSTQDFDDDWDSDDLLDDSFLVEITQNPELIATPKVTHCSKQTTECIENDSSMSLMLHNGLTGKESQQCGIDMNPGEFQRKNDACEKVKSRASFMLHRNSQVQVGERSAENIPKQTDFCGSNKPEPQKNLQQQNTYKNETTFNKGSPNTPSKNIHNSQQVKSGKSRASMQSAISSDYGTLKSVKQSVKGQQIRVEVAKQTTSLVDDWNESKFPDEDLIDALDDAFWDDDGDDDLLYQVCDDVEKLIETQGTGLSTNVAPSSAKSSNFHLVTYPNKLKSCPAPSAVRGMSAQSSYAAPENRTQNRTVGNPSNKPPATFNRSNSLPARTTTFGKDSSINATFYLNQKNHNLNVNSNGSVIVPTSVNDNKSNASKYVFTKIRSTSVEPSKVQCCQITGLASGNETNIQSYNKGTVQLHPSSSGITGASQHPSFKRHLSDSVAVTSKGCITNQRTVKCSQEEIERKKREALARLRMRKESSLQNGAPV
ncbi:ewing's tumor-associated antigen 1-like isoform X2 [Polyodon spathula]|uniref:ewing's tumor-associated antigen 1-like isoform X2 n=1 Tax=Polyodon spathula TaxID=7913 RepID=UPI001B7E930D|nr:ewing's tumor-associated antigen 1-like isoform X2 [Polyodon spathula]